MKLSQSHRHPIPKAVALCMVALTAVGCANRSDIVQEKPYFTFESKLTPHDLAYCIDRNVDEHDVLRSVSSKVVSPKPNTYEVVVLNGPTTNSVIKVIGNGNGGSTSTHYFGGVASIFPKTTFEQQTKGCQ